MYQIRHGQHQVVIMPRAGRPEIPEEEKQKVSRPVSWTEREYAALQNTAKTQGTKVATMVRDVVLGKLEFQSAGSRDAAKYRPVEVVGTIHAGEPEECREDVKREIVCTEHQGGDRFTYLEIVGDCMNKQVPEGAMALFERAGYDFGDTVAVLLSGPMGCELVLRVYEYDPKFRCQRLDPDSTNPDHKPILLTKTDPKSEKHLWLNPENAQIRGVFTGNYIFTKKGK